MVSVKDISTLHETCVKVSDIAQNILSMIAMLTNIMQMNTMAKLLVEVQHSGVLVTQAKTKVAMLEAELASLIGGLPKTAGALAAVKAQLAIAVENLALMEERMFLASELSKEFAVFFEDSLTQLNRLMERFNARVDSLNTRINHATNKLNEYLNTNFNQNSKELITQKSQCFEYQKLLYSMDKTDIKDIEKAYIEKLHTKKDTLITSKNASDLGVKMSQYNMPEFESIFEVKIAISDFNKDRYSHEKIANDGLKKALNDGLKNKFNSRQLKQIENNITPDGYTWHHDGNPPPGRLQLVESDLHNAVRHTGGYSLWCERG